MQENPLEPENETDLALYYRVANQFCYDLHFGPFILESRGFTCGEGRTNDLLDKFILIQAALHEKKDEEKEGEDKDK